MKGATCVLVVALVALVVGVAPAAAHTEYTVRPGDTLSEIAQRFDVSVRAIVTDNGLRNANSIRVGQKLAIPGSHGSGSSNQTAVPAPGAAPAAAGLYTVASGDTLSRIGAKLGVPWRKIAESNGLTSPYRLRVGQHLRVPSSTSSYPNLPARIQNAPERLALIANFERWSAHYGLPTELVMAVAYQETGWQNSLTSSAGAMGVGQIMPATADWLKTSIVRNSALDPWNADDNIQMMTAYLRWLLDRLGSQELAIAAYYQGQGSIEAGKYYDETRRYVANVTAHRPLFVRV